MKKTVLGKITLGFMIAKAICAIFEFVYLLISLYLRDVFSFLGDYSKFEVMNMSFQYLIVPILWFVAYVYYLSYFIKGKIYSKRVYILSIVILCIEVILKLVQVEYISDMLMITILNVGFILVLLLFTFGLKYDFIKKIALVLTIPLCVTLVVYNVLQFVMILKSLYIEYVFADIKMILAFVDMTIFPIIHGITIAFVFGYICFPDKYIKEN